AVTNVQTASQLVNANLSMNWMLTALGRFGYLVNPRDMVYVLGGWSFASFSARLESDDNSVGRTFTANGPAVGVGWERQIMDLWTFRAEYRYTKYLNRTLSTPNSFADTTTTFGLGAGAQTSTGTNSSSTTISSDMHMFRFGLARVGIDLSRRHGRALSRPSRFRAQLLICV